MGFGGGGRVGVFRISGIVGIVGIVGFGKLGKHLDGDEVWLLDALCVARVLLVKTG